MTTADRLLAVVEPTSIGDSSVRIAREFVSHGGRATIILVITDRVRRDIGEFADAEDLHPARAEAIAIDQLVDTYASKIGGTATEFVVAPSVADAQDLLARHAGGASTIVLSPGVLRRRALDRITSGARVPVVLAPAPAA